MREIEVSFMPALRAMKAGHKMKLPTWQGYWEWDESKETIMIHTVEGEVLDIRDTKSVEFTISNICDDRWIEATEKNCTLLGGTPTFDFDGAYELSKQGIKTKRLSTEKEFDLHNASEEDAFAHDWVRA